MEPKRTNEIHITIIFPADGYKFLETTVFNLQAPDFRIGFRGPKDTLEEYIEQNRRDLRRVYNEFGGSPCKVEFSFENTTDYTSSKKDNVVI